VKFYIGAVVAQVARISATVAAAMAELVVAVADQHTMYLVLGQA
jgi:hypothetical protein